MSGANGKREIELTLPIGYTDQEGRLHRSFVLRKMTGKEEAILADRRNQRNGGRLIAELLHSCMVQMGICPRTAQDRLRACIRRTAIIC